MDLSAVQWDWGLGAAAGLRSRPVGVVMPAERDWSDTAAAWSLRAQDSAARYARGEGGRNLGAVARVVEVQGAGAIWAPPVVMQGVAFVLGQLQGSRHAWGRQAVRSVGRQRVGELRPASLLPTPRTILVLIGRSRA